MPLHITLLQYIFKKIHLSRHAGSYPVGCGMSLKFAKLSGLHHNVDKRAVMFITPKISFHSTALIIHIRHISLMPFMALTV